MNINPAGMESSLGCTREERRHEDSLGALAAYGPATFVTVNALRLVGAVLGGVACERRKAMRPAVL
jgi:hypothetical protein